MTEANNTEFVTITVDGQELQAPKGAMLIEVTDKANIKVPRFCYHEKLAVAANCRMCLVEVEKAPKPLPACATPVMDGMVVHTRSNRAREAQKSVMEFLLINHPLDCPICDQGGECELQDVAMGYGQDVSEYVEGKRVVFDKNIGPLIATELTRCIHCTRCVRFGREIAGIRELGMTGRGENALIMQYSPEQNRYLPDIGLSYEMKGKVVESGIALSKAYGYDINLVEFNHNDGELIVINSTNPVPVIDRKLLSDHQSNWVVDKTVELALERVRKPTVQKVPFNLDP